MKVKEQVMRWVFAATAAFSIAAVALICVFLFLNGLPFFTKYGIPLIIVPNPATSSPPTRISRKSAIQAHCLHAK